MKPEELTKLATIRRFFDIKDEEPVKPAVQSFLEAMTEKRYSDGEEIVSFGADAEDGMYVIVSGQASVHSEDGKLINQLQEGDIIGELALINDDKRAATVKATGDVVCANITRNLFEDMVSHNRKLIGIFMSMLYRRTTELVNEREQIRYVSEHDQLTGLYNKGKYLSFVENEVNKYDSLALFNMDVNNLKKINDTMGHEFGDRLIIKAADSIKAVTNSKVMGFRMGGDEFLMIACNVSEAQVEMIKASWEEELKRLNSVDDGIECIIAIGVVYAEKPVDFDAMAKEADAKMYENKKAVKAAMGIPNYR